MWLHVLWFWYVLELFSSECRETKTKPLTYQLAIDYLDHLRTAENKTWPTQCLITFDTQLKTALTGIANGSRLDS